MKYQIKKTIVGAILISSICVSHIFATANDDLFHLKLVNQTGNQFQFSGLTSTKPNDVKGGGDLSPGQSQTYELLSNDSEYLVISYFDKAHNETIKFDLDFFYTSQGVHFKIEGGENYYRYSNICILDGNQITIKDKS